MTLEEQLILHEGLRLKMYFDTVGIPTIGCGRNLVDPGISYEEAMFLLKHDIARVTKELHIALPHVFPRLSPLRSRILIDMAFMGTPRLLGFEKMLEALEEGDYLRAAQEMRASQWAHQTKKRAQRLARWMEADSEVDV